MLVKLKAALVTIKANVLKFYTAMQPYLSYAGSALVTVMSVLAKLSSQLGLIVGIAIGYKLAPILRVISPIIKLVFDIAVLPLRFLGWL